MSEYDERGRVGDPQVPPGYPPGPPAPGPQGYGQPFGPPYRQGPQHPYPPPRMPWPPYPPQPRSQIPGWIWPVVAAMALVVGLIGGALGGAAVLTSADDQPAGVIDAGSIPDPGARPAPLEPENGSIAAVAKELLPSTVQISAREAGEPQEGDEPGGSATGSGFVLDRQGHVITNNHVVEGAAEDGRIEVIDQDGRARAAEIVGRSPVYDIAVLEVRGRLRGLRPAAVGSSQSMNIGETVVALGSPLGLSSTVTSGIVSAVDRPVTTGALEDDNASYINAVQTDAAINPGNSGGPLVNLRGQVVGVNSAIATTGGFGARPGNIGVGFAIPIEQVRLTTAQILQTGEAKYPVIGALVQTGGEENDGAMVNRVDSGGPAEEAGLRKGDLVTAIDETTITDGIALIVAIRSHQPGETVTLQVERGERDLSVEVTLDAKVG